MPSKRKLYLTKEFKDLACTKGIRAWIHQIPTIFRLLRYIYTNQKIAELTSFIIWEIRVRLGIMGRKLQFTKEEPMKLEAATNENAPFKKRLKDVLEKCKVTIHEMPDIGSIYLYGKNRGWGYLREKAQSLFHWEIDGNELKVLCQKALKGAIQSIFVTSDGLPFVCENGTIHRPTGNGSTFGEVLQMTYPFCYFRPHSGMAELPDHTLIMGEYGSKLRNSRWESLANIYISEDTGKTWRKADFLIREKANKHVHIVHYFPHSNSLILTDGDNKKRLWINDTKKDLDKKLRAKDGPDGWRTLTRFHLQMGGHFSAAEFEGKAFLGTDYLGGTNFMMSTTDFKHFAKQYLPSPYRRSIIYAIQAAGNSLWALVKPPHFRSCRGLLMMLKKGTDKWKKVIHFDHHLWDVNMISNSVELVDSVMIGIQHKVSKKQRVFRIEMQ